MRDTSDSRTLPLPLPRLRRINPVDVHHGEDMRPEFSWQEHSWEDSKAMDAPSQFPSGSARCDDGFDTGFCGSRECPGRVFA